MSDSPSIVDMYRQMEDERVALVAWLREQHAEAARADAEFDASKDTYDAGCDYGEMDAYSRVLERLGEKP